MHTRLGIPSVANAQDFILSTNLRQIITMGQRSLPVNLSVIFKTCHAQITFPVLSQRGNATNFNHVSRANGAPQQILTQPMHTVQHLQTRHKKFHACDVTGLACTPSQSTPKQKDDTQTDRQTHPPEIVSVTSDPARFAEPHPANIYVSRRHGREEGGQVPLPDRPSMPPEMGKCAPLKG